MNLVPSASSRKLPDGRPVAAHGETFSGLLAFSDKLDEGAWPKAAANNQVTNPVGDVEKAFDKFDGWHIFQKNCGVQSTSTHDLPSPLKYTEQLENRQRPCAESNSLFSNLVGFLSPVLFERRAA